MSIQVDTKQFSDSMDEFSRNQMPFATMKAINTTALDFQKAEQDRVAQTFTLRRPEFVLRTIYIGPGDFATKGKLEAVVRINPAQDVLAKFEDGGTKLAQNGGSLAIPIEVKTNKNDIVTAGYRPAAFQLVTQSTSGGYSIAKGLKRVFLIEDASGHGEIFQRTGHGKNSKLTLLYDLEKSAPIPADLQFVKTATDTVTARFPVNFKREFDAAMGTAR